MNDLLNFKDANSLVAEIEMMRTTHRGSFLLIEGDDDSKFWKTRIADQKCEIIICGGKKHVIMVIEKLIKNKKMSGILGVVDDDFDSLEGKTRDSPNLIATETHDLECLLLCSQAFEKVLAEYGNSGKIKQFKQVEARDLRESLLMRGVVFGRLRWLSLKHCFKINFDRLPPNKFINDDWRVDETSLFNNMIQILNQSGHTLTNDQLNDLIHSLPHDADLWKMCQGHDLISILAIAFRKVLGPPPAQKNFVKDDQIASVLRHGIEFTEFLATELAKKIKNWEQNNTPYQIFRAYH
ncbi:MAG: DUF4435 domain-containing protein [Thiotrichaceae bacterium]